MLAIVVEKPPPSSSLHYRYVILLPAVAWCHRGMVYLTIITTRKGTDDD